MSAREENEPLGIMGPWRRRARELRLKDAEHLSRAAHVPAVDPEFRGALRTVAVPAPKLLYSRLPSCPLSSLLRSWL